MVSGDTVKAGKLQTYYAKDDYYFPQAEEQINLLGSGAELYGLNDLKVSKKEVFQRLVEQREVKAFDLCFSAPKSVSILFATGDEKLRQIAIEAHKKAVAGVLKYIEENGFFQAVKKEHGVLRSHSAQGLLALPIPHSISREFDPQLHDHVLIANAALIPGEDKVRAVDVRVLYRNQLHFDQGYKSILRAELEKAGLKTRVTKDGFELADVTREQIDGFSNRSKQIRENLAAKGLTRKTANGAQRQQATMERRKRKGGIDPEQLRASWEMTAKELRVQIKHVLLEPPKLEGTDSDDSATLPMEQMQIVQDGLNAYLDTTATATRKDIVSAILKHANVAAQDEENRAARTLTINEVLQYLPSALKSREMFRLPGQTAKEGDHIKERLVSAQLLRAEAENKQLLWQGKGIFQEAPDDIEARLDATAKRVFSFEFGGEQRDAALGILRSQNFLIGVQGDPGTGKTTMLQAVAETYGRNRMIGLSVSGVAAKKLGDETGLHSLTVARFLIDADRRREAIKEDDQKILRKTQYLEDQLREGLIAVDEASMLGSEQANRLCHIAREYGARIVLVGDRYQLPGVASGKPFENWQDEGMQTFRLREIRRQRGARELEAVRAITEQQDAREAARILQAGNCVAEIRDEGMRTVRIVEDYMREIHVGRSFPLLITGMNKTKDDFNTQIRDKLKAAGRIDKKAYKFNILNSKKEESLKEFVQGDRIVFYRSEVEKVRVVDSTGAFLAGDGRKVFNGSQAEIQSIDEKGQVQAWLLDEEGRRTDRVATWSMQEYQFVDHSYALSTYKSQGQSVERLVQYHTPATSPLLSKNEFLVGISRNKNNVQVYTDDAAKMAERADQWVNKEEALRQFKFGIEQEQGSSAWVNKLAAVAQQRNSREKMILAERAQLVQRHGQFSKASREDRNRINEALAASREAFHMDLQKCHECRPTEGNMTDLELIAAKWLDAWREKNREENWRFSADQSPARYTNHYRRQNKIDGLFVGQLSEIRSGGGISLEAANALADMERIAQKKVFQTGRGEIRKRVQAQSPAGSWDEEESYGQRM